MTKSERDEESIRNLWVALQAALFKLCVEQRKHPKFMVPYRIDRDQFQWVQTHTDV